MANVVVGRFGRLLEDCAVRGCLLEGKKVHAEIVKHEDHNHLQELLGKKIVHMFLKCGSLEDARKTFETLEHRANIVLWTNLITAYAQNGHSQQSLLIFRRMQLNGVLPNVVTFVSVLNACCSFEQLLQGRAIHAQVIEKALQTDVTVGTALVKMYSNCGSLEEAVKVFEELDEERNIVTWSTMIVSYVQHERPRDAFRMFQRMQLGGILPDTVALVSILNACNFDSIAEGQMIHGMLHERDEADNNVIVGTALLNMYSKCGKLEEAYTVFTEMRHHNIISWTAMISAFAERRQYFDEAIQTFQKMQLDGFKPTTVVLVTVFNACSFLDSLLHHDKRFGIVLAEIGLDVTVGNALVNMYGKCGSWEDARRTFDIMKTKNLISWNGMFAAYAQNGNVMQGLELFLEMLAEGIRPNRVTYASILKTPTISKSEINTRVIQSCIDEDSLELDEIVGSALLCMHCNVGNLVEARKLFDALVNHLPAVSWAAIILAYACHGNYEESLQQFRRMQMEGVMPDKVILASIINSCAHLQNLEQGMLFHSMFCLNDSDVGIKSAVVNLHVKCGDLEGACFLFEAMERRSTILWNSIIRAYAHGYMSREALNLFRKMQLDGFRADRYTFLAIMSACCFSNNVTLVRFVHTCIAESGLLQSDDVIRNSLLNMYSKCGSYMEMDDLPTTASWNVKITSSAQHGQGERALNMFEKMQLEGVNADAITMIVVLNACSHNGISEKACEYFSTMFENYGVSLVPEHSSCMIDLLGRAGRLDEAEELVRKMPQQHHHTAWMALLCACRLQGDAQRAERALMHVHPSHASPYILVSNTYSLSTN